MNIDNRYIRVLGKGKTAVALKDKFPNATLQIGDGDHLAVTTQCITVSDFRQKHLAGGGEGAPLAVYGDYFLFNSNSCFF